MTKHWPSDRIGKAKREAEFQMDKDIFKEIIETKKKVDDLNNRINDGFIVEKIETEEEAEIINEALKILGQDFRLRPGDRLKFIKNGKLFYRHFSSENDHGVWERPFNVEEELAKVRKAERERCLEIARGFSSCEGIAQKIAKEIEEAQDGK